LEKREREEGAAIKGKGQDAGAKTGVLDVSVVRGQRFARQGTANIS